jgi:ribonuclease E
VPVEVASFLLNEKRNEITKIELRQRVNVLLVPNKHLETPNYGLERLKHDDPRLDNLDASYKLAEEPEEELQLGRKKREAEKPRQEAVVKGVTPEQPAPKIIAAPIPASVQPTVRSDNARNDAYPAKSMPAQAPASSGFFGWIKGLFGASDAPAAASPTPAVTPSASTPNASNAGANRAGGPGQGRGGRDGNRGGRNQRDSGRDGRGPRDANRDAPRNEGRNDGRPARPPRDAKPEQRGDANLQATTPTQTPREGGEARPEQQAPRERGERGGRGRGRGRGDRPQNQERNDAPGTNAEAAVLAAGAAAGAMGLAQATHADSQNAPADFTNTVPNRLGNESQEASGANAGELNENGEPRDGSGEPMVDRGERRGRGRRGGRGRNRGEQTGERSNEAFTSNAAEPAQQELASFSAANAASSPLNTPESRDTANSNGLYASINPATQADTNNSTPSPAPLAPLTPAVVVASPVAQILAPASAPVIKPFVLPIAELDTVANVAGMSWVQSDAQKVGAAQAALAEMPKPTHKPRTPKPMAVADDGPLVLVETKKDLSEHPLLK